MSKNVLPRYSSDSISIRRFFQKTQNDLNNSEIIYPRFKIKSITITKDLNNSQIMLGSQYEQIEELV